MASGTVAGTKIYKCSILMTAFQQKIQTGINLREQTTTIGSAASDCRESFQAWALTNFRPLLAPDVRIDRIEGIELTSKDYSGEELVNVQGTAGGANLTLVGASALVAIRSNLRSRDKNGRAYWPLCGQANGDTLDGQTLGRYVAAAESLADAYVGNSLTGNFRLVIVSPERPIGHPRSPSGRPGTWIDAETVKVSRIASHLHSRHVGVGA